MCAEVVRVSTTGIAGPGRGHPGERGTTIPLIVGLAVVLVLLVAVVADATSAFVRRQGLDAIADGAALQGANVGSASTAAYDGVDDEVRLDEAEADAQRAVEAYLRDVGAFSRYPGLAVEVTVDRGSRSVRVRLQASTDLPLAVPGVVRRAALRATATAAVIRDG